MSRPVIRTKHKIVAGIEAEFLKLIRTHNGLSRVELARQLNLAPSTSGIYVDRLKREGFLVESERVDRKHGRRPTLLTPAPSAGCFVGVDFEASSLMTTVVDFSLQVVSRFQRTLAKGESVDRILQKIEDAIQTAIKNAKLPLLGIGVGVPGVIDSVRGVASHYEFVPGWENVPVTERLVRKFNAPVHLENNIRSMAMAELWLGQGRGLRNFVCVGVRTGIGVGVVINGELYCGAHGGAGEIGEWPIPAGLADRLLTSGKTLEEVASLSAILRAASTAADQELDMEGLKAAVEVGNRSVKKVLEQVAAVQGAAIRQLHMLFDAERFIMVGPLADLGAALLTPLTIEVGQDFEGAAPSIVNSAFGQFGGALGAAALALHRWKPNRLRRGSRRPEAAKE